MNVFRTVPPRISQVLSMHEMTVSVFRVMSRREPRPLPISTMIDSAVACSSEVWSPCFR